MDSSPSHLKIAAVAFGTLAAASALFYFGTGEHPSWWAVWIATLVLLVASRWLSGWVMFGVSAAAFFLGSLNMLHYTLDILALPFAPAATVIGPGAFAVLAFMIVPACAFGVAVVLFGAFLRRGALWQAAVVLPAAWTVYEYLTSVFSPHGTFGDLAYTQMENLPLLQVASIAGLWGIDFCVLLLPAAIVASFAGTASAGNKRMLMAVTFAFFSVVLGFGLWRLQSSPPTASLVTVGLIASDLPANVNISDPGKDTQRKLRDYLDRARTLAAKGARVIVLPEKLGVTTPATAKVDNAMLQSFADESRADILVGIVRSKPPELLNEARLYEPGRLAPFTYDKQHLLPQFESQLAPGSSRTLINRSGTTWGIEICKDLDFPALSRHYGGDDVSLLLVSAWDFNDDDWLHARMAVMRGVEGGFVIARAAKEGLLTVSDSRGRVLAYERSKSAPFATLLAAAPTQHETTVYDRFGDWFAWLCIVFLGGSLIGLALPIKRST